MRHLYIKLFVVFTTLLGLAGCRPEPPVLQRLDTGQVRIDSTVQPDDSLVAFIQPYSDHVNEVLDTPLAYAPELLSKKDGALNTSLGNLLADIVLQQADTLSRRQTGKGADFALLNHGGLRSIISAGPVTERTSYEVMPFENTIYLVSMRGKAIRDLVSFLAAAEVPHPIAGIQIVLNADGSLRSVNIGGEPFDEDRTYLLATSNYLVGGGDGMDFFSQALEARDTGYRIRNAMTDFFRQTDTLRATVDDRFIKLSAR